MKKNTCKACNVGPNKAIAIDDDIDNPHCLYCGRALFQNKKKKTYGGIKLSKEANDRIKEFTKKQPNLYYTTKPMKPQIKSILIVLIGALLSALFVTIMCFGIKLIVEGLIFTPSKSMELKSICVSC